MSDPVGLVFASVNVGLSILILLVGFYGVKFFKTGFIVRIIKRSASSAVVLFVYFLIEAFEAMGLSPSYSVIANVLGVLFMLTILYSAYAITNDWNKLHASLS